MNKLLKHSVAGLTLFTLVAGMGGVASAQVGGTITRTAQPVPINAPVTISPWAGHWSEPSLTSLIERGLLSTRFVDDQRQRPETQVTVATAAELLLGIGRFPMMADRNVVDQAVEHEVILAADFADGKIDPAAVVSRELFAVWTARATGQKMMAEYAKIYMTPDFADADETDGRYRNAIALLQTQGIFKGNGNDLFAPKRALTLAEGVQVVYNTHAALDALVAKAAGVYTAELPAASSPGRSISLDLKADGSFTLSSDYKNGEATIVQVGSWRPEHAQMLSLKLTGQDGKDFETPVLMSARLTESGMNVLESKLFGEAGLQLVRS